MGIARDATRGASPHLLRRGPPRGQKSRRTSRFRCFWFDLQDARYRPHQWLSIS